MVDSIKGWAGMALGAFICFAAGAAAGHLAGGLKQELRQEQAVVAATTQVLKEERQDRADAVVVEARVEQTTRQAQDRAVVIAARLEQHATSVASTSSDKPHEEPRNLLDGCFADAVTVGLLNQARSDPRGKAPDAAAGAPHGEGQADPAAGQVIDGKELIQADQGLAALYWDLAIRHDELIDWISSKYLKSQD